ncbi:hypothetical protein ANCDUO_13276, partial [Ancylostoma duodenale]
LAGQLKPDLEMMAMCKVAIPGLKTGKEQTSEIKRGRDPIFNQALVSGPHDQLWTSCLVHVSNFGCPYAKCPGSLTGDGNGVLGLKVETPAGSFASLQWQK